MCAEVLFVSYGGSHVHMLKGVYGRVKQKTGAAYLALTTAKSVMEEAGLPYDSINRFVDDFQEIRDVLKRFGINSDFDNNLYTGIGLLALEADVGYRQAQELYREYGRWVLCPREFSRKILAHYQPKILITSNVVRLPRAMLAEAQKLGICTIYMEDLFGISGHPFKAMSKNMRTIVFPSISLDYIITISEQVNSMVKSHLKSLYIENNPKLLGLGNPNIEESIMKAEIDSKDVTISTEYILYLSNKYYRDEVTNLLRDYCVTSSRNIKIVIKTHPNEDEEYYHDKFIGLGNVNIISGGDSLARLIKGARIVLATNSTAALEAHLLGKNVYCLNPMCSTQIMELYVKTGVAVNIETSEELIALLDKNKYDEEFNSSSLQIARNSVLNISGFLIDLLALPSNKTERV